MVKNSNVYLFLCVIWWMTAFIVDCNIPAEVISRSVNSIHSDFNDTIMKIITRGGEGVFIAPFLLVCVLFFRGRHLNLPLIIAILFAALLPSIITNVLKAFFNAPRPLTVYGGEDWVYMIPGYENNFHKSFPSGHTTGAFACFAIASYLSANRGVFYPVLFFLLAVMTGISRVYLLQHFWEDVLWGSVVGGVTGSAIMAVYHRKFLVR